MVTTRYYRIITTSALDENNFNDISDSLIINCIGYENRSDKFECFMPKGRKDNYFLFMQDGELTVYTEDNKKIGLKKGQGIFFEAGKHYHYKPNKSPVMYYWVHFTGAYAVKELKRFGFSHEYHFNIGENPLIVRHFHKMFDEFTTRQTDFSYNASLYLLQIFVEIKRCILKKFGNKEIRLKKSLQYISENHSKDISINTLANIEGICVSRYRDIFSKQIGISPKQYITHQRITSACTLLSTSKASIEEVANKCGYPDIRYFYRVFKSIIGVTPNEFRKTQKH